MKKINPSIQILILSSIFFIFTLFFSHFLPINLYLQQFNNLHFLLEILGVCVSFTICLQGWLIYPQYINRQRRTLSAVFFAITLLALLHLYTSEKFIFNTNSIVFHSPGFSIMERFTVALGLCFAICMKYPDQRIKHRGIHSFALFYVVITSWILLQFEAEIKGLFHKDGISTALILGELLIIGLHLVTLGKVVAQYRKEYSPNLINVISGISFLILANINFMFHPVLSELNYFLAHIFKGIAYFLLLIGIYRSVVEESFLKERIVEEERFRIAEEYRETTQMLPKILFKFRKSGNGSLKNLFWEGGLVHEFSVLYGQRDKAIDTLRDHLLVMIRGSKRHCQPQGEAESSFIIGSREFMVKMKWVNSEVVGFVTEFTEWRQMELNLRNTQERFFKAFHANPWLVAIISMEDWHYVDVNQSFLNFVKCKREEVIGKLWHGMWGNPHNVQELKKVVCEQGFIRNREMSFYDREGGFHEGILSAEVIQVGSQRCLYTIIQDITEKKILEQEMARFDRLNAVGEMAATIAHEIRNPMTTVRGFLQMMGSRNELFHYKENMDLMIDEIDRVNCIITEFLSLAKNKAVSMKPGSLNATIKALEPLLSADAIASEKTINLELNDIPEVLMDEKEIRQLILNLVRNGLEAMNAGGSIFLRTTLEDGSVIFAVKDQGKGIAPGLLQKLGTPFLTTKESGNGLGLAVCYRIASRHKAEVNVETGGAGTTFKVKFPPIKS